MLSEALKRVEDAIISLYGITHIERNASVELGHIKNTPYATIAVVSSTVNDDSLGYRSTDYIISGAMLFASEDDLLDAMERIDEFDDAISLNTVDVSFERIANTQRSKVLHYGLVYKITFIGE